jgi:glycosyltransferase involved in cell wall biosynthesis
MKTMADGELKVLLLLEEGYPTRYWEESLRLLHKRGMRVTFATLRERLGLHHLAEELGFQTIALNCTSSRSYPLAVLRLNSLIRKGRFDILHFSESIQATVGGLAAVNSPASFRIFHRHHLTIEGTHRLYTRAASRLNHKVMAISKAVREAAITEGVSPEHVVVAHNGVRSPRAVSPREQIELRSRLNLAPTNKTVVMVGVLRPEDKGQRVLLDALPTVNQIAGPTHCIFVGAEPAAIRSKGRGPQPVLTSLRKRAEEIAPGLVRFVGHQPDVDAWLALADVVVVPSLRDGFGLTAIEAMASQRPVVASAVGGLEEIVIDSDTGVLVPPRNAAELGRATGDLLLDSARASKLADAGYRRYLERFTIVSMVKRWEDIYRAR